MFESAPLEILCSASSRSSSSSSASDDYKPLELTLISGHLKQGRVNERAMKRTIKQSESCIDALLPVYQQFYSLLEEVKKNTESFVNAASNLIAVQAETVAGSSHAKNTYEYLDYLCTQAKGMVNGQIGILI